jgi:hypothetical protein
MRLHNDEPTLLDQLGRIDLVQRVGDDVATCEPPHVFGIHGDWGSGKTSFLHQLQAYLTGKCPQQPERDLERAKRKGLPIGAHKGYVTVVWFEAWRYQQEKAPIVALLQEIRTQLPWYSKALSQTRKLGEVAVRSALLAFEDLTKKIGIQASKIQEVGEKWEQEHLATVLPSHMIREHLQHALKTLLGDTDETPPGQPRPRLVVMVDDLDRCEAKAAYKLIEGIKIYLNLPNCVFVLGMNQKIIEDAIAEHLPQTADASVRSLRAREYLDKLCQNIIHLPVCAKPSELLEGYLAGLPNAQPIFQVIDAYRCLPSNARKIKSFANLLRRYVHGSVAQRLADPNAKDDCSKLIVIFTCLYQFHPEIYRVLETYSGFYREIRTWSLGEPSALDHVVFKGLGRSQIAQQTDASATAATPAAPQRTDAFPDPAEGNVLRIQALIADFREVTKTEVEMYLVR